MAVLVVNSGSSSLKLSLFDNSSRVLDAQITGMHTEHAFLETPFVKKAVSCATVAQGINLIFKSLTKKYTIKAIGHRFVHGGSEFASSVVLDNAVINKLKELAPLAPLHNPPSLEGILDCRSYFGNAMPQVAVFDTAFYQTLPKIAQVYAIPYEYGIKRYGFHGISHAFLWNSYSGHTGTNKAKVITAHLGNGCSMTAIDGGRPIDTSMGFTPTEGLVMATRCGDIDPAVVEYLCVHEGKPVTEILEVLNFKSGLLGVSGISSKMETLLLRYAEDERAKLAVDLFCYRAQKYLGAYVTALEGADAIIFSGGIGENSCVIRRKIIEKLQWQSVTLDEEANTHAIGLSPGDIRLISNDTSRIAVYVIATDENRYIAEEVAKYFVV